MVIIFSSPPFSHSERRFLLLFIPRPKHFGVLFFSSSPNQSSQTLIPSLPSTFNISIFSGLLHLLSEFKTHKPSISISPPVINLVFLFIVTKLQTTGHTPLSIPFSLVSDKLNLDFWYHKIATYQCKQVFRWIVLISYFDLPEELGVVGVHIFLGFWNTILFQLAISLCDFSYKHYCFSEFCPVSFNSTFFFWVVL